MVLQHAFFEITDISDALFPEVENYTRVFFAGAADSQSDACSGLGYKAEYIRLWSGCIEYKPLPGSISNSCTVFAHPLIFEGMLRRLIMDLAEYFPKLSCIGCFRLYNSNWGYSTYSFQMANSLIIWAHPVIARQQRDARAFWDAMGEADILTIRDLFRVIYEPLDGPQRAHAFDLIFDLEDHRFDEVGPFDGYDFDDDGFPDPDTLADFAWSHFQYYGWDHDSGILGSLRDLEALHLEKDIPFPLPAPLQTVIHA